MIKTIFFFLFVLLMYDIVIFYQYRKIKESDDRFMQSVDVKSTQFSDIHIRKTRLTRKQIWVFGVRILLEVAIIAQLIYFFYLANWSI